MIIVNSEKFGTIERIREWVSENGLTQQDLADKIEVNLRSVNRWFNNGAIIRRNNLLRIAEVMDCDVEYLECKQGTPRRSAGSRIRLSDLSIVDRYLPRIQDLMKSTSQRFEYSIGIDGGSAEQITGSFVEGDRRYYYEALESDQSGALYYEIRINDGEPIRKSEEEITDFVKGIMKYISFEIEQLK